MDAGRGGSAHRGDVGAGRCTFRLTGEAFGVARAEPVQRRQERPLILVRLQRGEVEEGGQSVVVAAAAEASVVVACVVVAAVVSVVVAAVVAAAAISAVASVINHHWFD